MHGAYTVTASGDVKSLLVYTRPVVMAQYLVCLTSKPCWVQANQLAWNRLTKLHIIQLIKVAFEKRNRAFEI